ncbi:uncharacterized protein LOC118480200 [Helianthus annuus]|uniref:uncharacterized protein LOC118480200 n=1 Tax=Helianthus annuus TaxID=4232 RepID=UPI0016530227|nr:uncharacterized protein LOC118480200 [Helianthus annuus]
MDEDKRFSIFYIRKKFKKKEDLNKMESSKIKVGESENRLSGSKVVVARTSVKRRKSERIKGKWLSRVPGNPPDKPIILDESDTEEGSPLQVERVKKHKETIDSKVSSTQQPPAGTLLSDIAHLFPNVMDKDVVLQSEPNEKSEIPISATNKKGNETGKKRKHKEAGIIPEEKKAATVQTVKPIKEAAHEELVHDVFGVPRGNEEIKEVARARADFHEVVAEWKAQFESDPARLTPVQFKTYMQGQQASGRIFVLNFLLFYNTLLGETTTNSSINMKFLPALHRGKDIKSFNWCEYMIRCLNRTVEAWTPKEPFLGPMPLLVAALIRDQKIYKEGEQRAAHLIEDINDDDIEAVSIKLDSVRLDQILVEEYELQPEQRYPFAKKSDDDIEAEVVKTKKKNEPKAEKHITKCVPEKKKKTFTEKKLPKAGEAGKKKILNESVPENARVVEEIPVNAGFQADFADCMNEEAGQERVPIIDTSDIERYYRETGEWGQTQQSQPGISSSMASQYGSTPATQSDEVHAGMLEVFLNQFDECVKRITDTFTEGFQLYPQSEKIKEVHKLWTDKLKKVGSTCTTTEQPQTPDDKTPEKEANKENLDMSQLSQWTPSLAEEVCKTVDKTTTQTTQLAVIEPPAQKTQVDEMEKTALAVTPISQKTQEEYEYTIRRGRLIHDLDLGKPKIRPERQTELTDALRSPYVKRAVSIKAKLENAELSVSSYMFSAWGSMWDVVFRTKKGVPVMRSPLESLLPGIEVHILVISAWADLLNYEEKFKLKGSIARLFCSVNMLNEDDYIKNAKSRAKTFGDNMEPVLVSADVKKIPEHALIFVPVLHEAHFYCVCFNLKDMKVEVLDNSAKDVSMQAKYKKRLEKLRDALSVYLEKNGHPAGGVIDKVEPVRLEMPWRTKNNVIDCGVFLMRHMETYKGVSGKGWECGFSNECTDAGEISYKQSKEIDDLRRKYITKMLLSEGNEYRGFVKAEVAKYNKLSADEKKRLESKAYDTILARLDN